MIDQSSLVLSYGRSWPQLPHVPFNTPSYLHLHQEQGTSTPASLLREGRGRGLGVIEGTPASLLRSLGVIEGGALACVANPVHILLNCLGQVIADINLMLDE